VLAVDDFSAAPLRSECQALIAIVAGTRSWKDSRPEWLALAARRSGLPKRTIKALYYGEITDPEHPAIATLKAAAEKYELEAIAAQADELSRRVRAVIAKMGRDAASLR
jgi:hypothetical protein